MKYDKLIEVEDNAPTYSRRIAHLLNEQGLTQEDLAIMSGVSKSSITAWIQGDKHGRRTEPKIIGLNDVAKALGVTVDYLIGNTDVKQPNIKLQAISNYTGLVESSLEFLKKINSYKIGDYISMPVSSEKNIQSQVTCEFDNPSYILNLLLNNPHIMGLIHSYMCVFNDDDYKYYQGDRGSAILFELMLELRKLRDGFQPYYKEAFYQFYKKDGEE